VRWIRSYALEDSAGLGTVCVYEAKSPEAIRDHAAAAGLPVTEIVRVADTVIVRPDPDPAQAPRVELVRGVYDALARGDVPAVLGAMGDEVEWREAEGMPYGGVYHGGAAVADNVLGPITEDIRNFAVSAEDFITSGDTVAVVARYTGTGKTTGKRLDLSVVHVWDVRDDKIARFRQFADTAEFLDVVPLAIATRPVGARHSSDEGRA
jgi:ketosteroid isomerase-like protein